jgi:UDP-N-acetylglucosamine 2-epimerase (non-hydrolysing)
MGSPLKILHVVGARPNFMKVAPLIQELAGFSAEFTQVLVHTGQHYDATMSDVFFRELHIPEPDVNLDVGSGSHAWQTAQIMMRFEPVLLEHRPDWVVVFGDVNSTIACALVAVKLGTRVIHVEAGLRSFDRSMPEEINRLLTDQISDLLLTPSVDANENLAREGIGPEKIHLVGNIMIDSLVELLPHAETRWSELRARWNLDRPYILSTLHRPSNVDTPGTLHEILGALDELAKSYTVIFPVHPRTRQHIAELSFGARDGLIIIEPLGYVDFLALQKHAALVLTDSGGVQEETTYLGVPCLTVRPNSERPVTIIHGTNSLVSSERDELFAAARAKLTVPVSSKAHSIPPLWDGNTAHRIVDVIRSFA